MKKRIAALSAAFLLVFAFSLCTAQAADAKKMSKKAAKLMTKALKAIQEKKPDLGIDLLRQVIVLEPENAMVRHNLGVLLHGKGLTDEAVASFEEALRLQPDYPHAQLALRQTLFEAGKAASSKQEFEKANAYLLKLRDMPPAGKEADETLTMTRYLIGYNFFNLKNYPRAQEGFEACRAVEGLETNSMDIYANATYFLGMIAYIQKQFDDSANYFKKYLALYAARENKPEFYSHANFFIGSNLFQKLEAKMAKGEVAGMAESAAEILPYLNAAIDNKIPSEDAHVMLGNCYVYMKDYEQAQRSYEKLIELFPQSAQLKNYQDFLGELRKMQLQEKKGRKRP